MNRPSQGAIQLSLILYPQFGPHAQQIRPAILLRSGQSTHHASISTAAFSGIRLYHNFNLLLLLLLLLLFITFVEIGPEAAESVRRK